MPWITSHLGIGSRRPRCSHRGSEPHCHPERSEGSARAFFTAERCGSLALLGMTGFHVSSAVRPIPPLFLSSSPPLPLSSSLPLPLSSSPPPLTRIATRQVRRRRLWRPAPPRRGRP